MLVATAEPRLARLAVALTTAVAFAFPPLPAIRAELFEPTPPVAVAAAVTPLVAVAVAFPPAPAAILELLFCPALPPVAIALADPALDVEDETAVAFPPLPDIAPAAPPVPPVASARETPVPFMAAV
jgi:hypothetical protein